MTGNLGFRVLDLVRFSGAVGEEAAVPNYFQWMPIVLEGLELRLGDCCDLLSYWKESRYVRVPLFLVFGFSALSRVL